MTTSMMAEQALQLWRRHQGNLAVLLLGALLALLFSSTSSSLIARWLRMDEAYSHGFLMMAMVIWLVWRQPWPAAGGRRWPWLVAMLPLLLLWWLGQMADIILFEQLALPALWLLAVGVIWSTAALRAFAFPILLLYFAVPLWDHLVPWLVQMAVEVVSFLVARTDIPVIMQGNQIEIPSGIITVADGCSGERYLVVGLAFGVLAARFFFSCWRWRAVIIGLALLLGVLTNWVRIYLLVLIAYATEMQSSLMHDHEAFGFMLFGVIFALLVLLIRHFGDNGPQPPAAVLPGAQRSWPAVATALLALLLPLVAASVIRGLPQVAAQPLQLAGQQAQPWPLSQPIFNQGRQQQQQAVWPLADGLWLETTVSSFGEARDLLPYSTLLRRDLWLILNQRQLLDGDGSPQRELELRSLVNGERLLLRYSLAVGGQVVVNPYLAKLAEIPARLGGQPLALRVSLVGHCPLQECAAVRRAFDHWQQRPELRIAHLLTGVAR